jgi:hypothetical protein
MASFNKLKLASLALGSALLAPVLISACSSSGNPTPPVYGGDGGNDGGDATVGNEGGATPGDDGGSEAGPSLDAGTDAPSADADASSESSLTDAPSSDASGDADAATTCTGTLTDGGCWVCPSSSDGSIEFLNQCYGTGVKCVSFDNTRLPGFDAGLPTLN